MYTRESSQTKKIPVFGGFIEDKKNITPNTTIDHEAEVSFFIECVDVNAQQNEDIWASLESDASGDDDSIISFSKAT